MSVLTLEGWVEGGQVRLLDEAALPEKTKVYVVVPGTERPIPRLRTPRLADPSQESQFEMEVTRSFRRTEGLRLLIGTVDLAPPPSRAVEADAGRVEALGVEVPAALYRKMESASIIAISQSFISIDLKGDAC